MDKIIIKNRYLPDWKLDAWLKEEKEKKFMVWTNEEKKIEMHFPKSIYFYEKVNNNDEQSLNK